ncbi:unnamed protein product [Amoebophrya sp. A120]|nr:unnamed protein product [Amoebophrya sp. A120]|eukprot:GSA120T00004546001.1
MRILSASRRLLSEVTSTQPSMPHRFLPFHKARTVMHSLGLQSWREWTAWCAAGMRQKHMIPRAPHISYRACGWRGFPDFLGYGKTCEKKQRKSYMQERQLPLETFLSFAAGSYDFEILPKRAVCQLVFRPKGERGNAVWCPLILRSMRDVYSPSASFFLQRPRLAGCAGVIFLVASEGRFFYFPGDLLVQCEQNQRLQKNARRMLRIPRSFADRCEIFDQKGLTKCLEEHRQKSQLLREEEFCTVLFPETDIGLQQILHQAIEFLRSECGVAVQRPRSAETSSTAHYELADGRTLCARFCTVDVDSEKRTGRRVDLGLGRDIARNVTRSKKCASERCPDYLLAIWRDDKTDQKVRGFFIFPRKYLQDHGQLASLEDEHSGKSAFYVYPPWFTSNRSDSKKHQVEQEKFFVDLSTVEGAQKSVQKVQNVFSVARNKQNAPPSEHNQEEARLQLLQFLLFQHLGMNARLVVMHAGKLFKFDIDKCRICLQLSVWSSLVSIWRARR